MILRIILAFLCLCSLPALGEVVTRNVGEAKERFAERHAPPGGNVTHVVIETNAWHFIRPAIIAFYQYPYPPPDDDPSNGQLVTGYVFVPVSKTKYEKIEIDTYGPEGRSAEIDTVVFANAGNNSDKIMFVLASWHPNPGDLYRTYVYEKPRAGGSSQKLPFLEQLGLIIDGGCIYCRKEQATASDIKAKLKRLHALTGRGDR